MKTGDMLVGPHTRIGDECREHDPRIACPAYYDDEGDYAYLADAGECVCKPPPSPRPAAACLDCAASARRATILLVSSLQGRSVSSACIFPTD